MHEGLVEINKFVLKHRRFFIIANFLLSVTWYTRYLGRRKRLIHRYSKNFEKVKVHLGCGDNKLQGWINTDLKWRRDIFYLNVVREFPFPSNTVDYIFSEHMIEHLTYLDAKKMLENCYRVLKPGGKIRIATPDFDFLIKLYTEDLSLHRDYIKWHVSNYLPYIGDLGDPSLVINNFFRAWGHKTIFNRNTLTYLLKNVGFENIVNMNVGQSADPDLTGVEHHGDFIGEEYNLLETMVLEAQKIKTK